MIILASISDEYHHNYMWISLSATVLSLRIMPSIGPAPEHTQQSKG
ncbi:hypothetical protein VCHA37P192_10439 [Vibrio chagasii]|nr:hypothetical protein VCHA37P192_10439 [Vibrio chagasii]